MNYFDIIVLIPVLWFGYKGFAKGFVVEIASLAALLLGIWGGTVFSGMLSRFMTNTLGWTSEYIPVIAFALTFILIVTAVHLVARLITKLVKAVSLSFINRIAGALFGAAKVVLLISMLLVLLNQIDSKSSFLPEKMRSGSLLYEPVASFAPLIFPGLSRVDLSDMNPLPEKVTIEVPVGSDSDGQE